MARTWIFCALVVAIAAPVAAADRLTDKDVKALVSSIEEGRDRFDNALDGNLKRSILRGPSGEVNVDQFLNDFQESIDRLEERLKPEYAASNEAGTLLRQASAIDAYFRRQPAGTKGESEWNRLATDLKALAVAYGTDFPLPENATVRRMGDREVAAALDQAAKSGERLKKSLDTDLKKDATVDKPSREAIVKDAEQLSKDAKALRARVQDGKPASAEVDQLLGRARTLHAFVTSRQLPTTMSVWSELNGQLQKVAAAYGVPQ